MGRVGGLLTAGGRGGPGGMTLGLMGDEGAKPKWIPLNKLADAGTERLAKEVKPLRMVMIVGGFPYKKQVEEFQAKLHYRSPEEVLDEVVEEKDKDGNLQQLPGFRFLGVEVQRQTLDPSGKVLKPWETLDLNRSYLPLVFQTGKNIEPEDPKFDPIEFDGLVMQRLKLFQPEEEAAGGNQGLAGGAMVPGGPGGKFAGGAAGGRRPPGGGDVAEGVPGRMTRAPRDRKDNPDEPSYPDDKLVENLASLKKTLQAIKDKDPKEILKPPPAFDLQGFDVFARDQGEGMNGEMGGMMPGMPGRPGMSGVAPGMARGMRGGMAGDPERMGKGGRFPGGMRGKRPGMPDEPGMVGTADLEEDLPEYCMVRLMDVDVQPGTTYQYRLRVRMANPNYNRKDVASAAYAKEKEIKSDWYDVPQKAHVPPELYYYAVDQKDLDPKGEKQLHKIVRFEGRLPDPREQVMMQAHKWLLTIPFKDNKDQPIPVGDWAVAERFPVYRGEIIGRRERVEVPVWRPQKETMSLLTDSTTRKRNPGVDVNFGYDRIDQKEAILVDFEGGRQQHLRVVKRSDDPDTKPTTRPVDDESSTDVLILSPDGKLLAHNTAADAKNPEREKRLKEVRDNILKSADEGKVLNNLMNNPAGGRGGDKGPFGGN
jgi:hypothetical protein